MAIDDQSQCAEGRPRHAEGSAKDISIRYSKYTWETACKGVDDSLLSRAATM